MSEDKEKSPKKRPGRPSKKTDVLMDAFLDLLIDGDDGKAVSSRTACKMVGIAFSTFWRWLEQDEEFQKRYARAKSLQVEFRIDEIVEISEQPPELVVDDAGAARIDSAFVQYQKLRIDTRKWEASKLLAKKYGDKITQEITGKDGGPVQSTNVTAEQLAEAVKNVRDKF